MKKATCVWAQNDTPDSGWMTSACGYTFVFDDDDGFPGWPEGFDYCPHCGKKVVYEPMEAPDAD